MKKASERERARELVRRERGLFAVVRHAELGAIHEPGRFEDRVGAVARRFLDRRAEALRLHQHLAE
jgi:hypothetical protein